jgi:hypothetical protein
MLRLLGVWRPTRQLMLLCIMLHDLEEAKAPYMAGGLEVNGAGFPTAVRDGVLSD